ncbi:MAG: SDR family oxidoreductase [Deltaproteobacteria bacterium]|nr:SDR family oxidoreductase [Deltaproteobacteria bacterium]MDZ4346602.1 SDR family oxidoreductase [Candidatus Binatia bacterium]
MKSERPAALVTGAATGIGRSAAVALAKNGYDVVINYSHSEEAAKLTAQQAQAAGAKTLLFRCDVSDDARVRAMVAATEKEFGRLDVLINNAGTTVDVEPKKMEAMKVEDWNRVFNVNVLGLFLVTRAAAPLLKKSPNGCVVNTCSIAGLRPSAQPLPYAASKAAVANLTKTLANALGPEIRVNAVAPGWIEGEWMKRTLAENYDGLMARRAKYTPLKRCCTEDDVAESMMSLIVGNHFVTGEIIIVDGGFSSST